MVDGVVMIDLLKSASLGYFRVGYFGRLAVVLNSEELIGGSEYIETTLVFIRIVRLELLCAPNTVD